MLSVSSLREKRRGKKKYSLLSMLKMGIAKQFLGGPATSAASPMSLLVSPIVFRYFEGSSRGIRKLHFCFSRVEKLLNCGDFCENFGVFVTYPKQSQWLTGLTISNSSKTAWIQSTRKLKILSWTWVLKVWTHFRPLLLKFSLVRSAW